MKNFIKFSLQSLFAILFVIALSFSVTQNASANTGCYGNSDNNYYNNGYNNNCYQHENYSSNQQYYLSPYMTSTQPYYIPQNYYPNNQYYNYSGYNNGYDNYNGGYYSSYNSSYNSFYNSLYVSCSVNKPFAVQNEPVTWTAHASGGSNRNYNYSWSGTDGPASLNSSSINVAYGGLGIKNASVTVWSSDGQRATAYCGQVTVGYPQYPYGQYSY